jgi:hypothetical protein
MKTVAHCNSCTTKAKLNFKKHLREKNKVCSVKNIHNYKIPRKYTIKTMITDF